MHGSFFARTFFGLFLIGVGALFLLNQLDMLPGHITLGYLVSTYWPVVLIVLGLKGMMTLSPGKHGGSFFWDLLLLFAGLAFLARNLDWITVSFRELFQYGIPVLLILLGFTMLVRSGRGREASAPPPLPDASWESAPGAEQVRKRDGVSGDHQPREDFSNQSRFIGDIRIGSDYEELKPMNMSVFIGDTDIDLTQTIIPFGETTIHLSAFIGDIRLKLPADFELGYAIATSSFLGDTVLPDRKESGMIRSVKLESTGYEHCPKRIRIIISLFLGDIEVKGNAGIDVPIT